MFRHGGRLLFGALIIWMLGIVGIDFLVPNGEQFKSDLEDLRKDVVNRVTSDWNTGHRPASRCAYGDPDASLGASGQPTGLGGAAPSTSAIPVAQNWSSSTGRSRGLLAIGAFNIQVLGQSKISDRNVANILADVIRKFDVIAIQELRWHDDSVIVQLMNLVNQNENRYDYVISERLGRTSSKEQYVFVYDRSRVRVVGESFIVPDRQDYWHREPMASTFQVKGPPPSQAFTFTLLNIHTDPDEVAREMNALPLAIDFVRRVTGDDDVIVLGDLNTSAAQMYGVATMPNIVALIGPHVSTKTNSQKSLDNLLLDRLLTTEFAGASGVFDLQTFYHLSPEQAARVSDHLPVWGLFTILEAPREPTHRSANVANQPAGYF